MCTNLLAQVYLWSLRHFTKINLAWRNGQSLSELFTNMRQGNIENLIWKLVSICLKILTQTDFIVRGKYRRQSHHIMVYAVRPSQSLNNLVCVRLATIQAIKTRLFVDNSLLPWMDSFALRRTSKSRLLRWNEYKWTPGYKLNNLFSYGWRQGIRVWEPMEVLHCLFLQFVIVI